MYIALPVVFFLLSIIIAAAFYAKLPADVAYHFQGSTPDRTVARVAFVGWMVIPQIFFTLIAISITRMVIFWAKYVPPGETPLSEMLPVMGNIMALPQIILFTVMLQLILHNAFNTGIIPLWIFATVILVIGAVITVLLFVRVIRKYRKKNAKHIQELK